MSNKSFNARLLNKTDTEINWSANNPVILSGELAIVEMQDKSLRIKIGDGIKRYNELPFSDSDIYNELDKKGDSSFSINSTLLSSGWSNGSQSISSDKIKLLQNGIASLPQNFTNEQYEASMDSGIYVSSQEDGVLTFSVSENPPTIDIPILIILFG